MGQNLIDTIILCNSKFKEMTLYTNRDNTYRKKREISEFAKTFRKFADRSRKRRFHFQGATSPRSRLNTFSLSSSPAAVLTSFSLRYFKLPLNF